MDVVDFVARRIDVDAADHVVVGVEHRVRESGPLREVARMPFEIAEVLLEAERSGPAALGPVAGRAEDVLDARRPRRVVALVVLGAKGLEPKRVGLEPKRRLEARRDEHEATLAGRRIGRRRLHRSARDGARLRTELRLLLGLRLLDRGLGGLRREDRLLGLAGEQALELILVDRLALNEDRRETAKRIGANVTVVIWRDDGYGLIDWKQRNEFGRPFAVEFGNPDFVAYAESFGLAGFRPASADDLYPTLMRALDVPGPAVVEVPIDYRENLRLTERLGSLMRGDG